MISLSKFFTPGVGAALNFGLDIWSAGASKSATAIASWQKWEADTKQALRKAVSTNKANYRAHQVDMTNWISRSNHVEELRRYENLLASDRAELKTETSINAMDALGRKYADLNARFYEEEASETIQLENLRNKLLATGIKTSGIARGQAGRSVERIGAAYNQQWLQNASNKHITRKFRIGDRLAAMQAANADAMNKSNSVTLYNPRPFADPVQPLAPLPAELHLPGEPKVSGSLNLLDYATAGLNAYNTYMEMRPPNLDDGGGGGGDTNSGDDSSSD